MKLLSALLLFIFLNCIGCNTSQTKGIDYDVDIIVYGGTSAAVTSAVQARRMGKSVIIVCPDKHLGGLSSGGLGWTDTGDKSVIGGMSSGLGSQLDRPAARNSALYCSQNSWAAVVSASIMAASLVMCAVRSLASRFRVMRSLGGILATLFCTA